MQNQTILKLIYLSFVFLVSCLFEDICFASEENISVIVFSNQSRINTDVSQTNNYGTSAYGGETGNYSGLGYGLLYEKPIKNNWSFETGLAYFARGYVNKDPNSTNQTTYNWNSLYLPLVGRFRPTKIFTGFIGGYASYALGSVTTTSKVSYLPNEVKGTQEFKSLGYSQTESGLTYGAGINLSINNATTMIIEVRLNEGLSNIIDPNLSSQTSSSNSNNNSSSSTNTNTNTNVKAYMRETWIVVGFLI